MPIVTTYTFTGKDAALQTGNILLYNAGPIGIAQNSQTPDNAGLFPQDIQTLANGGDNVTFDGSSPLTPYPDRNGGSNYSISFTTENQSGNFIIADSNGNTVGDYSNGQATTSQNDTLIVTTFSYNSIGPTGSTGATGATGPTGATGQMGATGDAGATGATGGIGATGATGAAGPQGPIGATGATGADGATGAQGPIGATGATGAVGATGAQGSTGATGAQGIAGATGAQGIQGATGPVGATGAMGTVGATGAAGPTGPQGIPGPKGTTGDAASVGIETVTATQNADSTTTFNFSGGPYFDGKSYSAVSDTRDATGALTVETRDKNDGSHATSIFQGGQTVTSNFFDTVNNGGAPDTTFVFNPGFGRDVVDLFRVDGADHDTLSFKGSDYGNDIATVLASAKNTSAGLLITDPTASSPGGGPGTHDTLLLKGITKQQLAANQGDITFHA